MDYNPSQQRQFGEPKNHSYYLSLPVHRALCWWPKVAKAKHQVNTALTKQHTSKVIELVLSWLYSLRNQIIHGGATWNSQVNCSQLNDEGNLQALWGEANYPMLEKIV